MSMLSPVDAYGRLADSTQNSRGYLLSAPVIGRALAGDVTRDLYVAFLTQAYHHVKHTVPLLMAVGSRLDDSKDWLRSELVHYVEEEHGHEQWILNDIAAAGGDAERVRRSKPHVETDAMVAYAYDVAAASLANAQEGIQRSLSRLVRAEKMTEAESQATFDRIRFTQDLAEAVSEADVVIEAAPEILELKQELWRAVVLHAPVSALLGTNTSQLSVTRIASCLDDNSSRLIGIHFFNPPVMMKLVELISGINTDPAEIERASEFAHYLGKEVVVCRKDSPGFITSRAYAILRLECVRMLEEGIATAEDIDKALRLGFNFPMGPLELGDMNGIDTYVHALTGLAEAHGERFRPTVGLKNMVAAGRLGRKSGRGFYRYDREGRRESNSDS